MGRRKTKRRNRLARLAAGFAAVAAAILPGLAVSAAAPVPEAIEAEARTTAPARLLDLASVYPEQVLANRLLRRLRVTEPAAHREIVLAARFGRAERALAEAISRTDETTLRVFACDCAARVAPLYERFAGGSDMVARARERAAATAAATTVPAAGQTETGKATAAEIAFVKVAASVDALENEVAREAFAECGATGALRRLIFERSERRVSHLERWGSAEPVGGEPPFRLLAVALPAAEAVDEALVIAAGGDLHRLDKMCEAIAHAIYLEHAFATGEPQSGIDAVFREIAWQRSHLGALRSSQD
jgi:hypothetical protein